MSKVWLIVKEEDYFYDDKYYDCFVFDTEESARKFYVDYIEILLYELEQDYIDRNGDEYDPFGDMVEVDTFDNGNGTRIYLDDAYYISVYLQKKEVMSVK